MAEQLGEAVLKITVDDSVAKDKLGQLRQELSRIESRAGGGGRTAGGARESVQALERAQSRRFALAQRIERLEERGAQVSRLRARLGDLTTAQSQRQFGTARQLSVELDRQVKLANARFRREQDTAAVIAKQARLGGPRESVTGRRGLQGSPADLAFLARQGGARSPIGGAANIPGSPAFLAAQQRSAQQQAAILSAEIARQARLGGARSSIRGATDVPGSPAFLAAQKRAGEIQARAYVTEVSRLARQGGARSPIGGAVDIPGSPAFLAAQRRFSAQELSRAAAIGGPRSPIGGAVNLSGSPAAIKAEQQLAEARAKAAKAANDAAIAEGRRIGKLNAAPVKGGVAFPGSPEFLSAQFPAFPKGFKGQTLSQQAAARSTEFENRLAQARKRSALATEKSAAAEQKQASADLKGRISSGLIGGAFPLLFGQGPGAALGGLAGGVAGGGAFGFGASLVGTGIGASFDALIARSKELAEALRDPLASFDQLKAASVLSSRGLETYIEALIKTGQTAKAEQLIRADLTQNVNPTTAAALSQANDELARSFSDVQEKLSALVAGPAIAFLQWLDDIVDRLPIRGPGGAAPGQLPSLETARRETEAGRQKQNIGLGLAGGSLGVILAATALAATGIGAPVGAGLLTYGLLGAGAATVGAGKFQEAQGNQAQNDLATQRATAGIQKEIEAIQARRVALQKQLVGFTGNESSAAAQIAQGQNVALAAQEAILTARKAFASIPFDASPKEAAAAFDAYKKAVAAARLEVEKLVAANNNQAANLKRTTDLRERTTGFTPGARQGAELADAVNRAREGYDKAKVAYDKAVEKGTKLEIAVAASQVNSLGQTWRAAVQNLRDYNAELQFTQERQARINASTLQGVQLEVANAQKLSGLRAGPERNAVEQILNIQAGIAAAKRVEESIANDIATAQKRGDTTEVANLIGQQQVAAENTKLALIQGADALRVSGQSLRDSIVEGARRSRSLLEGSFNLLRAGVQERLLGDARRRVNYSVFDPDKLRTPSDVFAAASASEELTKIEADVAASTDALANVNSELGQINKQLVDAVVKLVEKDWSVNAYVNLGTDAEARAEILAAATLP